MLTQLLELQPKFKGNLEESVQEFKQTVSVFTEDYDSVSVSVITRVSCDCVFVERTYGCWYFTKGSF